MQTTDKSALSVGSHAVTVVDTGSGYSDLNTEVTVIAEQVSVLYGPHVLFFVQFCKLLFPF